MKKLALIMLAAIILITGCGLEEKKDAGATQNKEKFSATELANLPQYFEFYDYLDENNLVGLTKNKPFIYQITEGKSTILSENQYWNLRLSPDKKLIAFNNEEGLGILELSTGHERMIYEEHEMAQNNFYVNGFMWSADSQKLLLKEDQEFGAKYQLISLKDKSLTYLAEGLLREVAWLSPEKILFTEFYLTSKKDNQYMSMAWREDLLVYDLRTGGFSKLTDVDDREYFSFIATLANDVYIKKLTLTGQQVLKLNIPENKLEEINEIDSGVLVMKNPASYLVAKNERFDEKGSNSTIDLSYQSGSLSYELGSWTFALRYPKVFLFSNSIIISSSESVPVDQHSFTTEYRATLYNFTD